MICACPRPSRPSPSRPDRETARRSARPAEHAGSGLRVAAVERAEPRRDEEESLDGASGRDAPWTSRCARANQPPLARAVHRSISCIPIQAAQRAAATTSPSPRKRSCARVRTSTPSAMRPVSTVAMASSSRSSAARPSSRSASRQLVDRRLPAALRVARASGSQRLGRRHGHSVGRWHPGIDRAFRDVLTSVAAGTSGATWRISLRTSPFANWHVTTRRRSIRRTPQNALFVGHLADQDRRFGSVILAIHSSRPRCEFLDRAGVR